MLTRVLVVASLFAAASAYAQAPGATEPMGPGGVPPQPVAGDPCTCGGPAAIPVMDNRWAVGLSVGGLGLAPKDAPDNKTDFGVGELSLRYRATLHLELELAVGGGREKLPDGSEGDREVNAAALGVRYRFRPERAWNWWVSGSVGGLAVTPQGATDQERKDAQRPMGQLGVGIERRFRRFALQAELRAIGVGTNDSGQGSAPVMTTTAPAGGQMTPPPPPPAPAPDQGQSGGQFTIGASYYF